MLRLFLATLVVGLLAAALAAFAWSRRRYRADGGARSGLVSGNGVEVSTDRWIVFRPRCGETRGGLVFYPGGKAEPTAYAPLLKRLAAHGFLVVLVPMPLNLAVLGRDRAAPVQDGFPAIGRWVIGGHSLGGAVACQYAHRHPGRLAGLLLWASYPGVETDLSGSRLPVLSISATADDLTTPQRLGEARTRLPPQAREVAIADADHWCFGDFAVPGCLPAPARDAAQDRILELSAGFLAESCGPAGQAAGPTAATARSMEPRGT